MAEESGVKDFQKQNQVLHSAQDDRKAVILRPGFQGRRIWALESGENQERDPSSLRSSGRQARRDPSLGSG